jgi:hypothetical protein
LVPLFSLLRLKQQPSTSASLDANPLDQHGLGSQPSQPSRIEVENSLLGPK